VPQGTYFIMVDIGSLGFRDDVEFCRYLTTEIGVAAIPPSAFYHNPADGAKLARFAFCKSEATLEAAASRLVRLKAGAV
jgi:N-succinyldiaminopimelate aminotransferase